MASEKSLHEPIKVSALQTSFDVDFVIKYNFANLGKSEAESQFAKLIAALDAVGLDVEVRNADNCTVLVFVKIASEKRLESEVYRARVHDWLYGVRTNAPQKDIQTNINEEPVTEAERLRLIFLLMTRSTNEGGAGITPKTGDWKNVDSIFALHDQKFNKAWVTSLTSKYFLTEKDFKEIKDRFGEKIAFYFRFLQSYFLALTFPAFFGFCSWVLFGKFSPIYAIVNGLWCIGFTEYWRKQESELAVRWGVRGVSKIQRQRANFKYEREIEDPFTGEQVKIYSPVKRLARQLLQVPFAIAASVALGSLIAGCFGIEIFISEVYAGPFKGYLAFLPTVILTLFMPTLTGILTGFAERLTEFENYETVDGHEASMVQKIFVLNFITSYLPIFLTAFVYVPFAQYIVPHLDVFQLIVKPLVDDEKQMATPRAGFQINPDRLQKQVIYFTVTAQIVNFAMEIVVPYITRKVFKKVKEVQADRAAKNGTMGPTADDHPEEADFLQRVRNESELVAYDVTTDFREMVVQFGYLSLFSVIWPLTAVSFLINNWIELRGDALKIAMETQRPVPWRADSIGPWLDALGFLSWLGSLTTAALVYLFSREDAPAGTPGDAKGWGLLLTMFFAEHIYLAIRFGVNKTFSKIDSPGSQKERADRVAVKRQYLEEISGQEEAKSMASGGILHGEPINKNTLEEAARASTLHGHGTPEERFWKRQQGKAETIAIGVHYISKAMAASDKKESKKEL